MDKTLKIWELNSWFLNYFDKQIIQSLWQKDFKPSFDNYFNKSYETIEELKEQAQIVRQQLKELTSH